LPGTGRCIPAASAEPPAEKAHGAAICAISRIHGLQHPDPLWHPPTRVIGRKAAWLQRLARCFTTTERELNIRTR